jgi:hypothetical protein
MRNKASIRKRLNEVRGMTDTNKALSVLADIQYEIGLDACAERTELRKEVNRLRVVVMGNGDPSHSIITRLSAVEVCMGELSKDMKEIKAALLGDVKGKGGILQRLKDVEDVVFDMVKFKWIIIGLIAAQVVSVIVGLF